MIGYSILPALLKNDQALFKMMVYVRCGDVWQAVKYKSRSSMKGDPKGKGCPLLWRYCMNRIPHSCISVFGAMWEEELAPLTAEFPETRP